MSKVGDKPHKKRTLEVLLLAYLAASFLHSIQDAEYARAHPLPGLESAFSVYITWVAISTIGLLGYLLYRSQLRWVGQALLGLYAAVGLDAASHYARAPIAAYSRAMNISIFVEVVMAFTLLLYLLITVKRLAAQ